MKYLIRSAYRNIFFQPFSQIINLLGLSVSLALVIILSVYCFSELTTDSFHVNRDLIYLFHEENDNVHSPGVLKDQIDLEIPGVKSTFRLTNMPKSVFQFENNEPITSDLLFADPGFFEYLTYQVIEGDIIAALNTPNSVVLKKSFANKLFGKNQALGKVIKLDNKTFLTVSAIINDPKENSCLSFNAVSSIPTYKMIIENPKWFTEWKWRGFLTFLCLEKDVKPKGIVQKIVKLYPVEMQKDYPNASITSLNDIYFSDINKSSVSFLRQGSKRNILIQLMIAILVVFVALINFIHINSSIWLKRIRQTGIMKVTGASRMYILMLICFDTFFIFLLAFILAIVWVVFISHYIQILTGIVVNSYMLFTSEFLFISISLIILFSLLFSLVPAYRISNSKVINDLNNRIITSHGNSSIRAIMVSIQFVIAIVLIAVTLLVNKQINYGCGNIGVNQENIIAFNLTPELLNKHDVIKNLLDQNPSVKKYSFTTYKPGEFIEETSISGKSSCEISADGAFFDLMGIKLQNGRLYDDKIVSDYCKVVVNETYLKEYEIDNPIGNSFRTRLGNYEIVGVIKDFHFKSFNKPIEALMICNDGIASYCQIKIHSDHLNSLKHDLDQIQKSILKLSPTFPVDFFFLDQAIENQYQNEIQFQRTLSLFAFCAIVICSMGIFAISLLTCQHRTKEIGIRKVNGAKIFEIISMLNKAFVKWVIIAFVIATPISYYAMDKWLENFAYKTELSWWIFALAGLLALGIALLTVSWQSWKAATRNPVEALRYE